MLGNSVGKKLFSRLLNLIIIDKAVYLPSVNNISNYMIKDRITQLLQQLNERVYEKEHIIALSLLSAIAGESIFLLGPPGTAKSMVARRLKLAFKQATAFEYLMSRFSTPDEIFGPVSISKLKDEDTYERRVEGYLPTADVVFLDEIWKAGPAIQNALLTVLNEKVYRNGQFAIRVPLKGLIAASNELPAIGQGLEALWDRFLIRLMVTGVEDMGEFDRMIASTDESEPLIDEALGIGSEEYAMWNNEIQQVRIHYSVFEVIHLLKEKINLLNQRIQNDGSAMATLYVSDRRWKKMVKLLRTSAYLNGRDTIGLCDCALLAHCLWSEVEQIEEVNQMVQDAIRQCAESYLLDIKDLNDNIRELRENVMSENSIRENFDPGIQLIDNYYYQIEGVRMRERLLIFASDYQQLDDNGKLFFLQKEKYKANTCTLKKYDPMLHAKATPKQIYTLKRGLRSILINGYEYKVLCHENAAPPVPLPTEADIETKFSSMGETIGYAEKNWEALWSTEMGVLEDHLFLNEYEKRSLKRMFEGQRNNIGRYRNELNELIDAYRKEKQEYQVERPENDLFP